MQVGIVGLPNVGKSTLFNALTAAGAAAANYPFCTIDPNVGVVPVPDDRLEVLAESFAPETVTPATIEFGGMTVSDAQKLRTLEQENGRLKRLLAEAMLDNAALKDLATKNF